MPCKGRGILSSGKGQGYRTPLDTTGHYPRTCGPRAMAILTGVTSIWRMVRSQNDHSGGRVVQPCPGSRTGVVFGRRTPAQFSPGLARTLAHVPGQESRGPGPHGHEEAEELIPTSRGRTWAGPPELYDPCPPQLTGRTRYQNPPPVVGASVTERNVPPRSSARQASVAEAKSPPLLIRIERS